MKLVGCKYSSLFCPTVDDKGDFITLKPGISFILVTDVVAKAWPSLQTSLIFGSKAKSLVILRFVEELRIHDLCSTRICLVLTCKYQTGVEVCVCVSMYVCVCVKERKKVANVYVFEKELVYVYVRQRQCELVFMCLRIVRVFARHYNKECMCESLCECVCMCIYVNARERQRKCVRLCG